MQCPPCRSGKEFQKAFKAKSRLQSRFMRDDGTGMSNDDLLQLILLAALPPIESKRIAEALLKRFGSLGGVIAAPAGELHKIDGVNQAVVVTLRATREVGVRATRESLDDRPILGAWDRVIAYCRIRLAYEETEKLHILFLDGKNALIADEELQRGTVDHVPVYPREIMKRALELGATALVMVHNHPCGNPTPSADDVSIKRDVVGAAALFGIKVHDHVVISREGHASLRTLGLM